MGRLGAVHYAALIPFLREMCLDAEIGQIRDACEGLRASIERCGFQLTYHIETVSDNSDSLIAGLAQAVRVLRDS